jgi:hypothetical protein
MLLYHRISWMKTKKSKKMKTLQQMMTCLNHSPSRSNVTRLWSILGLPLENGRELWTGNHQSTFLHFSLHSLRYLGLLRLRIHLEYPPPNCHLFQ